MYGGELCVDFKETSDVRPSNLFTVTPLSGPQLPFSFIQEFEQPECRDRRVSTLLKLVGKPFRPQVGSSFQP